MDWEVNRRPPMVLVDEQAEVLDFTVQDFPRATPDLVEVGPLSPKLAGSRQPVKQVAVSVPAASGVVVPAALPREVEVVSSLIYIII